MKRIISLVLYMGIIILLVSFAMMVVSAFYYEGGTPITSHYEQFSFTENFLTDLGRSKGYDGIINSRSQYFFERSVQFLLFTLPVLHLIWVTTFQRHRSRLWAGASIMFMVLACFHLWGVLQFPQDQNFPRHFLFLSRALISFALAYLTAYFAYYFEPKYAFAFAAPFLIAGLIIGFRWVLLLFGPDPFQSNAILMWHLSMQKLAWLAIYGVSIYHLYYISRRLR